MGIIDIIAIMVISFSCAFFSFVWGCYEALTRARKPFGFMVAGISIAVNLFSFSYLIYTLIAS